MGRLGKRAAKGRVEIRRGSNVLLSIAILVCSESVIGCDAEAGASAGPDALPADTSLRETASDASTDAGPDLPEVLVEVPSAEDAFSYLWYVLTRMPFYAANGYRVDLPDNAEFSALAESGIDGRTDESYYFELFAREVYSADDYAAGLAAVHGEMGAVRGALPVARQVEERWGFVVHDPYRVRLTLYGPGGSYDPTSGAVTLKTTPQGTFRRPNPSHTIVHEMVHMGVQHLVDRFELTHWEKERLVDLFCLLLLAEALPGYQGQSKGDRGMDPYATRQALERDLPAALAALVASRT